MFTSQHIPCARAHYLLHNPHRFGCPRKNFAAIGHDHACKAGDTEARAKRMFMVVCMSSTPLKSWAILAQDGSEVSLALPFFFSVGLTLPWFMPEGWAANQPAATRAPPNHSFLLKNFVFLLWVVLIFRNCLFSFRCCICFPIFGVCLEAIVPLKGLDVVNFRRRTVMWTLLEPAWRSLPSMESLLQQTLLGKPS